MTSATPSVETYSAAVGGKYVLCELAHRYGEAKLPKVITVDMKAEIKAAADRRYRNGLKNLSVKILKHINKLFCL